MSGPSYSSTELAKLLRVDPPTVQQAEVIEAPLGPGVVIAGAGSGKTETMAARVVWLVANRMVEPEHVLGLTFTRKAAAELGRRIRRRLAQWRRIVESDLPPGMGEALATLTSGEPTVLTYAAYAGRLVNEQVIRLGEEPATRVLTPASRWQQADLAVRRFSGDMPFDMGALSSIVGRLIDLSDQLADHLRNAEDLAKFVDAELARIEALADSSADVTKYRDALRIRRDMVPILRDFAALKRGLTACDFGDQMAFAARLAHIPEVAVVERDRYRAVLLDEYQDTGHAQIHMLQGLFGEGHPVTAVGDPFQSIYAWRGAAAGNIGRFRYVFAPGVGSEVTSASAKGVATEAVTPQYPLSTSWRNDSTILAVANAVSAPLTQEDDEADQATVQLQPRPGAGVGEVISARLETVATQAEWVAAQMAQRWHAQPVGERTAAVLVRRRSDIPALHDALVAAELPVEVVGLGGLLHMPEVADVRATLHVLADDDAAPALMRLLTGARWRIGARDLEMLGRRARHLDEPASLIEALDDLGPAPAYSESGYRRMRQLADELGRLRRRLSAPLVDLVAEVESTIGVGLEVASRPDGDRVGRVHLDRFHDEVATFSAESDRPSLAAFLAFLKVAEDEENGLEQGEAELATERVQILTIHGAKGLEWNIVAVPGLVSDVFPSPARKINWTKTKELLPAPLRGDRSELPAFDISDVVSAKEVKQMLERHDEQTRQRHLVEERRLAYVAFTRAQHTLLLSTYCWDTTQKQRDVSIFLDDVRALTQEEQWHAPADDEKSLIKTVETAQWPIDPLGNRRSIVTQAAELVRTKLALAKTDGVNADEAKTDSAVSGDKGLSVLPGLVDDVVERGRRWSDDVDLLLAERERQRSRDAVEVLLPNTLSVSQLVTLQRQPDELARQLRRPMPMKPAPWARRGTRFHSWLEQRWFSHALIDIDALPGSADADAQTVGDDAEFESLREAFEHSDWGMRTPHEVEVGFDMTVAGVVIRGRMDAVFANVAQDPAEPEWVVVDWKTGHRPAGAAAQAAAVQLAAYRMAWARICGIADDELHRVGAAFHYVRDNHTERPVDLLDTEGLTRLITDR